MLQSAHQSIQQHLKTPTPRSERCGRRGLQMLFNHMRYTLVEAYRGLDPFEAYRGFECMKDKRQGSVASCSRKSPNFIQHKQTKKLNYIFKLQPVHFFSYTSQLTKPSETWSEGHSGIVQKEGDETKLQLMASFVINNSVAGKLWVSQYKGCWLMEPARVVSVRVELANQRLTL